MLQGVLTRRQASLAAKQEADEAGSRLHSAEEVSGSDNEGSAKEGSLEKGLAKASLGRKASAVLS